MHWNTIPGPGNLSLERSSCKIIGFHSRNLRSWAQNVTHFYDHKFTMRNGFTKFSKIKKTTWNHA